MTAHRPSFSYTTLSPNGGEVRLLKFEDNGPNDPLSFSLGIYNLSETVAYNSMSYEWGNADADRKIFVNNHAMYIRDNLHSFLKALANSKYRDCLFFVDAISINQHDIPERNAQVKRMGDVYRQAESVLAWLGPGTAQSDSIFDLCTAEAQSSQETEDDSPEKTRLGSIDFNKPDGQALDSIYQRSYWGRLWIIQELFLASDVIVFCGSKFTPWSVFKKLPRTANGVFVPGGFSGFDVALGSTPGGRHARKVLDQLSEKDKEGNGMTDKMLHELVWKFGRAQCTDIRDRVYGLLGLARAHAESDRGLEVVADYSATPVELFIRLLGTVPRVVQFGHILGLFNLLKLHHDAKGVATASIPAAISNLKYELSFTHLGHLKHSGPNQTVCDWCYEEDTPYAPTKQEKQDLQNDGFFEIMLGVRQSSMASHGVGPWNYMQPHDSCVAEGNAKEGDDVYLLQGSNVVLLQKPEDIKEPSESRREGRYLWGILADTKTKGSISRAAMLRRLCHSSLPYHFKTIRSDTPDGWVEILHIEFTLRHVLFLLGTTGQHNDYWNDPL